jgi:hypothetical protein
LRGAGRRNDAGNEDCFHPHRIRTALRRGSKPQVSPTANRVLDRTSETPHAAISQVPHFSPEAMTGHQMTIGFKRIAVPRSRP